MSKHNLSGNNYMHHLGRSIAVKENAISHEKCDALMTLIDNSASLVNEQSKDNGSYSSETRYSSIGLTMDNSPKLDQMVRVLLVDSLNEYQKMLNINFFLGNEFETMNIMKFYVGKDKFDPHFDANGSDHFRTLAIILYLNDVDEGGELILPSKQNPLCIKPSRGKLIIVPANWTCSHQVTSPISNNRYSLITFLRYTEN
jgi:predicted 2-oxoglutarate/Fe(II)-dependent dioxygenase YbiX